MTWPEFESFIYSALGFIFSLVSVLFVLNYSISFWNNVFENNNIYVRKIASLILGVILVVPTSIFMLMYSLAFLFYLIYSEIRKRI